jgi:hypothetical protein
LFLNHRQYRAIPNGARGNARRSWIVKSNVSKAPANKSPPRQKITSFLVHYNNGIQEAYEERWNAF